MACRQDWRPFRERAALRAFDAAQQVDERALRAKVKPLLKEGDVAMRAQMVRGVGHNEALLQNSKAFNDKMGAICNAAMEERDVRVCAIAKEHGADGLAALRVLGAIVPPWLRWKPKETRAACRELAETLDSTRPNREFELRSRVVRLETAQSYGNQRTKPSHLALRSVDHVISAADVANLRAGRTLVIDPQPALITPAAMASVHAELSRIVAAGRQVTRSANPCNDGSYHGMLPTSPKGGELGPHTSELLRKLAALPAIVERFGWPRRLACPPMVQLGFYPGGSGAKYRPHLDRWASEVNNRRELTFLVYVNVGWDAETMGGCLRLHPAASDAAAVAAGTVDIEPVAGRVVVFESGRQMHEVCESRHGADRLALTLWVEYEGEWSQQGALTQQQ